VRILVVGAGGVGSAMVAIAHRRDFFEHLTVADLDQERAARAVAGLDDGRLAAAAVDASSAESVAALAREMRADVVVNACDPRLNPPIFDGAFAAGTTYLDMAMHLSHPHPEHPYTETGEKLGDAQFAVADQWESAGRLALVGVGVEPGLSDVFARYAADHLFTTVDEVGVRDGANLEIEGFDFAPTFSIWTTIE